MPYTPVNWSPISSSLDQYSVTGGLLQNCYAVPTPLGATSKTTFILYSSPPQQTVSNTESSYGLIAVQSPKYGNKLISIIKPSVSEQADQIKVYNLPAETTTVMPVTDALGTSSTYSFTSEDEEKITSATKMVTDGRYVFIRLNRNNVKVFDISTSAFLPAVLPVPSDVNSSLPDEQFSDMVWTSGYFVLSTKGGQIFHSNLNSIVFDQLDFANAESKPDGIVGLATLNLQLYVFGERTIEVWTNTGAKNFAFTRNNSFIFSIGCDSRRTIVELDTYIVFLGSDGIVYAISGGTGLKEISNVIVTDEIQRQKNKNPSTKFYAWKHIEHGHRFYCLKFSNDLTWVCNVNTGFWHTMVHPLSSIEVSENFSGKDFVAGSSLDIRFLNRGGVHEGSVTRYAETAISHVQRGRACCHSFEVDIHINRNDGEMEQLIRSSVGLTVKDPDTGVSDVNRTTRVILATHSFIRTDAFRIKWTQLGQFRDRVFRVEMASRNDLTIKDAHGSFSVFPD